VVIGAGGGGATEEYKLTAGPTSSTGVPGVRLNGKVLLATEAGALPAMQGRAGTSNAVVLAPASIAFVVLKGAGKGAGCP